MSKNEFTRRLRRELSGWSNEEVEKSISFYEEIIADRIEDGMSEDEAVKSLGNIEDIAKSAMSDMSFFNLAKTKIKKGSDKIEGKTWLMVLAIAGSPIWIALLASLFAVIISLYFAMWMVIFVLFLICLISAVCGFVMLILGVFSIVAINPLYGMLVMGSGLVLLGLGLILYRPSILVSKGIVIMTKGILKKIKLAFARLGGEQ